ncbi:MAG: acyltransferase [Stenotrophomonas sp.]|uniref:acyltransferase n=1 Tax=Stenotrophomonas sp. TaxID=69392 RepID=UPI0029A79182|nr:acyltransferase [Stenotrophomonas sp.]MDX3932707.1 acyltransferase [Stenotrophomonas sp.]
MRNQYWDAWKGGAVLAVVLIHATGAALEFPPGTYNHQFAIALRQFINFPVALFVFLTAFFSVAARREDAGYIEKAWKRISRLMVPYLIWAAVYAAVRINNGVMSIGDVPLSLVNGKIVSVGYYVIVMVQFALLAPALDRLNARALCYLIPLSVLVSCSFTYAVRMSGYGGDWAGFPYNAIPFFLWLPFYLSGLLVAKAGMRVLAAIPRGIYFASLFAMFGLSNVEAAIFGDVPDLAVSQLKFTSIGTSLVICCLMAACVSSWGAAFGWKRAFVWLGSRSYYFYLAHMLVLVPAQRLLSKIPALYAFQPLFVPLAALFTIFICAVGALVADRVLQGRIAARRAIGLA